MLQSRRWEKGPSDWPESRAGHFGPIPTARDFFHFPHSKSNLIMDNTTFGLTMLLVGMGGTLLTLWVLAILIGWLTKACQSKSEGGRNE
jgi:hypothetical protein